MPTRLAIATPGDEARVLRLVAACHAEAGIEMDEAGRADAVRPLLEGTDQGVVYLVGPPSSPVGYVAISFGYALSLGGIEACIDEVFVRPAVRRRGLAGEAIEALMRALPGHGVKVLRARCGTDDRLFARLGFAPYARDRYLARML